MTWHCECRRTFRYVPDVRTDGRGVCEEECGAAECYRKGRIVESWRVPAGKTVKPKPQTAGLDKDGKAKP